MKSNGKKVYSIKEKISYYLKIVKTSTDKLKVLKAKEKLKILSKEVLPNKVFGKVYMVSDKVIHPAELNTNKSRRVVGIDYKNGVIRVIPIMRNNLSVKLSKFDNERYLHLSSVKSLKLNDIYSLEDFGKNSNDYLTEEEKIELIKKLKLNKLI
ncbi:MAG: hypothetical protein LBM99_01755 [Bacillales bacterium]|jgi:hypothetical protein|nr:hypothetical protein [Bacillales bacterium]